MRRVWMCILWFVVPALAGLSCGAADSRLKVVGYVPNWVRTPGYAEVLPYSNLTHLHIAFENPTNTAGGLSHHPVDDLIMAQARRAGIRVLLSVGGGGAAENPVMKERYAMLMAPGRRTEFSVSLADHLVRHGFDGLDVDIEGPSITKDYDGFVKTLSDVLRPRGKLLTAALSQGYGGARVSSATLALFDYVNVMAYDAAGPWSPGVPGPHSSIEFAQTNVTYWLGRGVERSRLILGVPFYGYGFGSAFRNGVYPYSELVAQFPGAAGSDVVGSTIWYNGIPTIVSKVRWVRSEHLGGVMIWSVDMDAPGPDSLLHALWSAVTTESAP